MGTVFVLLPVHNRREITRRFVECLAAQTRRDFRLLLLDDGSIDGTADMVRSLIPDTVVLRGPGNWWWAGALQAGVDWLRLHPAGPEDVVLIINDDTEFDTDFLARGTELLASRERTLVVAQLRDRSTGEMIDAGQHVDWRRLQFTPARTPEEINCCSTRGLFLRARDLLEIGGFHPRLLPHYLSDYEFTIRAHRKGWRLFSDPSLTVRTDRTSGGFTDLSAEPLRGFLSKYFSRKHVMDPLAWTAFVALACPWPWKPWYLGAVWGRAAADLVRAARRSRHS
jgi:GT2 family glycosyltransferase